ncbi:MAG: ABC transporter permease subunit [Chloroflexi bacterium]|nr:ABC transporter permease subunit [Chloroflexota bacterium]
MFSLSRLVSRERLRALALDWLIWAYLPAAVLYYFRASLKGVPGVAWFYLATIPVGLVVALVMQRFGHTLGERATGLAAPAAAPEGLARRGPPWYRTQVGWTAVILALVTFVLGWNITEIDLYSVFTRADRMANIVDRLVRPYWPVLGVLIEKMVETIFLALMATALSIPLAALVAFFAARNLMMHLTAPWGRLLASFVLGVLGALGGLALARGMTAPLEATRLDAALLRGILSPLLGLVGLVGCGYLGSRLIGRVERSGSQGLSQAVQGVFGALAGAGAAYVLGSAVAAVGFAASWAIFVRECGAWPYALLGLGAVAGVFYCLGQPPEREFAVGALTYNVVRFVLNTTRSIEPFVWALVFVTWFRLGPFPGMVALLVHSVAALGKLYSESIEGIDAGPLEAVRATGANELQVIAYAVVPQVIPPFISFTIYRWDINVRMSTIIGLVGGGGIGQLLFQYQNLAQWRSVSVTVILIVAVVMTLDLISARIREHIL